MCQISKASFVSSVIEGEKMLTELSLLLFINYYFFSLPTCCRCGVTVKLFVCLILAFFPVSLPISPLLSAVITLFKMASSEEHSFILYEQVFRSQVAEDVWIYVGFSSLLTWDYLLLMEFIQFPPKVTM